MTPPLPNTASAEQILKKFWGYDSFRSLQKEIIDSVTTGHDTLGLMPTGGGKSITFQVSGLMLGGLTVVVTPLISLMKDQVDNLRKRNIRAVFFHAGMKPSETSETWDKLVNGKARFAYISPERLSNERFINNLRLLPVTLIVVDEAHCISQWGYDFRPSYLNIKKLRHLFPSVNVLALTATATDTVAKDICRQLEMEHPEVLKMSFSRSNLNYIVRPTETKIAECFHILSRTGGSSIIYVRSRKRTREIAEYLNASGIYATYYHAGLDYETKAQRQTEWMTGKVRVMVATNAFGMGIDKPDVRVVIHFDFPPSLEEYYQEAGRAGRDGLLSYAVLLVSRQDKSTLRRHLTENFPDRRVITKIYERAANFLNIAVGEGYDCIYEFNIIKFADTFGYAERQIRAAMRLLSQSGYMEFIEDTETRSRVMMMVDREELYSTRMPSTNAEKVLRAILRRYTGLFIDFAFIYEPHLATDCHLDEHEVYEALIELSKNKIIKYVPRSRTPLIYMPTSREEPRYLTIPKTVYEERKEVMTARLSAIIDYGYREDACREEMLLTYFDEKTSGCGCGTCDYCRKKKTKRKSVSDTEIADSVINAIKASPAGLTYTILESMFSGESKTRLRSVLSFLCNEGLLHIENGLYRI